MMNSIEAASELLRKIMPHEDWEGSQHLTRTPERFVEMLKDLTTPEDFEFTTFENSDVSEMVIIQDIPFYSLCAHHIVPFVGYAHIGYIPDGKVAGLSKFARLVQSTCRGLWVQEELTSTIGNILEEHLVPKGVAVVMKGEHQCMTMRGAQVPGTKTTTSYMGGVFDDHTRLARGEFLELIKNGK